MEVSQKKKINVTIENNGNMSIFRFQIYKTLKINSYKWQYQIMGNQGEFYIGSLLLYITWINIMMCIKRRTRQVSLFLPTQKNENNETIDIL